MVRGLHIAGGVVALFTFVVPLLSKKGGLVHRRAGKVYVAGMFVAAITGVAILPLRFFGDRVVDLRRHVFLAYVGVLAFNSAFQGVRVLRSKGRTDALPFGVEHAVAGLLLVAGLASAAFGIVVGHGLSIGFGALGVFLASTDLRALRRPVPYKQSWYVAHMSRMGAACIATVTAFLVVNAGAVLPASWAILAWVAPGVIGGALLTYWGRVYAARFGSRR